MDALVAAVGSGDLPVMYLRALTAVFIGWPRATLMKPSTHETAPHGLAPLPAHPGDTMSGLDMHRCLGGGHGGSP